MDQPNSYKPYTEEDTDISSDKEKTSTNHASSIQQPKPNTRLATRLEIQSQEPDSISQTAQIQMESKKQRSITQTANASKAINDTQETETTNGQFLPFIWPIPTPTTPFLDPKTRRPKCQRTKSSHKHTQSTPRNETIPWRLIPIDPPTDPTSVTINMDQTNTHRKNLKEKDLALYTDRELSEWIVLEYDAGKENDWAWFAAKVLGQGTELTNMFPRMRRRVRSETSMTMVEINKIDKNHYEIGMRQGIRTSWD